MLLITKILMFVLIFSVLIVLKETVRFLYAFATETSMKLTTKREIVLACAISYIITIIACGFDF